MPDLYTRRNAALGIFATFTAASAQKPKKEEQEAEVTPGEDLMQEHGVLKRVLLVYRECLRRMGAGEETPPEALTHSAGIIRTFVEDYHEKTEEQFLFPRFRKAGKLVDLVDTLKRQHDAGRVLTQRIQAGATAAALKDPARRTELRGWVESFVRMYEPHEAREDTVLFPAFRKLVSPHEYGALGEEFEKREHQLLGAEGFEKYVARIADVEKTLGIYELAHFTPAV